MDMFEQLLGNYASLRNGATLTEQELGELIVEAKDSRGAHPALWVQFAKVLEKHTDLKPSGAKAVFRECRITSDLHGSYPYSVVDFIPAFLKSRGYTMKFSGEFGTVADTDFIYNQMIIWSHEILGGGAPVFADTQIKAAFGNWRAMEKERLKDAIYETLKYDPVADANQLDRFARLITKDSETDERDVRATVVAVRNFIYRVKNHLRRKWYHGIHLMPVLYGPQASGKTTAIRHFLSPLSQFTAAVGFDIFEHDEKMYALSVQPVMFFDELAGISKAENERLKDVMHTENRELRRLYGQTATRTIVTTFIGGTNKDISTLIRDETGNRRYLQISTPLKMDIAAIKEIDVLAMWRSVDEDGEPPLYANANDLKIIQDVQSEQRHYGRVEHWLEDDSCAPERKMPSELFTDHFIPWVRDMYPGQDKYESLIAFGKELTRILNNDHPRLVMKYAGSGKRYTILPKVA